MLLTNRLQKRNKRKSSQEKILQQDNEDYSKRLNCDLEGESDQLEDGGIVNDTYFTDSDNSDSSFSFIQPVILLTQYYQKQLTDSKLVTEK